MELRFGEPVVSYEVKLVDGELVETMVGHSHIVFLVNDEVVKVEKMERSWGENSGVTYHTELHRTPYEFATIDGVKTYLEAVNMSKEIDEFFNNI